MRDYRSVKPGNRALEQVVVQFALPFQAPTQEIVDGLAEQIRDALHAIDGLLEQAGVVEHHPQSS